MSEQETCPKCGSTHISMIPSQIAWAARNWECLDCGVYFFVRYIPLPEGTEPGDSPWSILQQVPLKPHDFEMPPKVGKLPPKDTP